MIFPATIPSRRRGHRPSHGLVLGRLGMACLLVAFHASAEVQAGEGSAAAARPRISDPAIQPAGGASCTSCGQGGCRHPHAGHHHGHHAACRDGVCAPYCPVRPQQFGFYGTQWRRWPGQAIVPVSAERDAAPVSPPRSAVPGPGEESLNPEGDSGATGDNDAGESTPLAPTRQPLPEPAFPPQTQPEPGLLEPAPESRPEPKAGSRTEPEPQREPSRQPPGESATPATEPPAAEPAKPAPETTPRPEDENLFEVLSGWRARRKFPVAAAGGSTTAAAAPSQEGPRRVGHSEEPRSLQVPRVPFDPAAETRRLRSAR